MQPPADTRPGPATAAEVAAIEAVCGPPAVASDRTAAGGHALARSRRHLLLPALHALVDRVGFVSAGGLALVCERLGVAPADAYGVASFYALLPLGPHPGRALHVCDDVACRLAGGLDVCDMLAQAEGPPGGAYDGGAATWHRAACLGLCDRAPAALLTEAGDPARREAIGEVDPGAAMALLNGAWMSDVPSRLPQHGDASLVLLRRVGVVDPASLDDYRAHGGYEALGAALRLGPAGVRAEVRASGLVGRGGAAFPTATKWDAVAAEGGPRYLVCNADESEPGTFKDRVVMEGDPFAVVEAMTVAAYATGCAQGWVYVRDEYPLAEARVRGALAACRAAGLLGPSVAGSGFAFDVEVVRGAGAYVCGEETALFNSIEGHRGEPRTKPPFPTQAGLLGRPTVVNNVETLVNVLPIVLGGGTAYAAVGTPGSTGTKLFCLSGAVARPGVYEVPFGETLGGLLARAGGVGAGRPLQAVLLGGAAGSFVGPDRLDLVLSFEAARDAGTSIGSGVVVVLDDRADLADLVARIARFFRDESCGQCVPCRVGTQRQVEVVERLAGPAGAGGPASDLALLDDIARAMADASICGLGQTAAAAVTSAVRLGLFPKERP